MITIPANSLKVINTLDKASINGRMVTMGIVCSEFSFTVAEHDEPLLLKAWEQKDTPVKVQFTSLGKPSQELIGRLQSLHRAQEPFVEALEAVLIVLPPAT